MTTAVRNILWTCIYPRTPQRSRHSLIESNKPGSQILDKPSILLVSQPDASLPGVSGDIQAIQAANTQVTTLISAKAVHPYRMP